MDRGNQSGQLKILEGRAAAKPNSIEDIHNLADAYADQGRWDDAIRAYKTAITLQPTNADLYNSLGTVCEEVGDFEAAERAYKQAVQRQPEDSIFHYKLGSLYEEQQRQPEAMQAFENCLLYSSDPDERSEVREKLSAMLPERKDVVRMYRSLRGGFIIFFVLGVLSVISDGAADPFWGILLIAAALLSWRIKIPSIFVLHSVVLARAAVMNGLDALSGAGLRRWFSALILLIGAVSLWRDFRKYNRLPLQLLYDAGTWPANYPPPQEEAG